MRIDYIIVVMRDLATTCAHTVRAPEPTGRPATEPLYQTSVFEFSTIEESLPPLQRGEGYVYARYGMPNARSLELTVAALEGAADALATSSGMSALACAVMAACTAGDRVVVQNDAYGGTIVLAMEDFRRLGIEVVTVDAYDPAAVAAAMPAKIVVVETISNPLCREVDIPALAGVCRAEGALLLVDNTFATPVLERPIAAGAPLVLHSATKFLGGHHDLCAGVLAGDAEFIRLARGVARRFGMQAAPLDAWLCCRGIRTLAVRIERAQENARALADKLRGHGRVRGVCYPGRGAMLSFDVGSGAEGMVGRLGLIALAPSLGGTATTVHHPATSSHANLAPEARRALGIGDGLLRLSVGIESVADLWGDIDQALG
jgi:methionine-gamma-lyase